MQATRCSGSNCSRNGEAASLAAVGTFSLSNPMPQCATFMRTSASKQDKQASWMARHIVRCTEQHKAANGTSEQQWATHSCAFKHWNLWERHATTARPTQTFARTAIHPLRA